MKKQTMNAVGMPLNRSARRQKLELAIDPSQGRFLSLATSRKERIGIRISRRDMAEPIQLSGTPVGLRLRLQDVEFDAIQQIGLLEFFMNDEQDPTPFEIELAYTPEEADLPWDEEDGEEVHHGDTEDTEKRGGDREEDSHAEDAEDAETCEGCGEKATRHDGDGVPLCDGCMGHLAVAASTEKPGQEEVVEVLEFKPKGIQNARVVIRVMEDATGLRWAQFHWTAGNTGGAGQTDRKEQSVLEVLGQCEAAVPKSLAACEMPGGADAMRAAMARRDKFEALFDAWISDVIAEHS